MVKVQHPFLFFLTLLAGFMLLKAQHGLVFAQTSRLVGPWPKKHFDEQNTGQSNLNGPSHCAVKPKDGFPIHLFTSAKTSVTVGPNEQLFMGLGFHPLCELSPDGVNDPNATASEGPGFFWCTQGGGDASLSSPTIALDPELNPPGVSPPPYPNDVFVYMGARDNKLWAVKPDPDPNDPTDFTVKWRYKICRDGDIFSSVNIDPDTANIAMTCGCVGNGVLSQMEALPALDANTIEIDNCATPRDDPSGERQWLANFDTDSRQISPAFKPAADIADRRLYVCDNAGTVYAYKADTPDIDPTGPEQQTPEWQLGLRDAINPPPSGAFTNRHSSPVVKIDNGDTIIYIGSSYGLHAIRDDGTSSTPLWSYDTADKIESTPALASDGTIFVGDLDGIVYAINPDGSLKWQVQITRVDGANDTLIRTSPAIAIDGTVYLAAKRTIFALDPDTGDTVWKFASVSFPIKWSSPAIGSDDTLYIPANRKLYAFVDDTSVSCDGSGGNSGGNPDDFPVGTENLIVNKVIAPSIVSIGNASAPCGGEGLLKRLRVLVKNTGGAGVTIENTDQLNNVVKLSLTDAPGQDSLTCEPPTAVLTPDSPPQKGLPFTILPNKSLSVFFDVPFNCALDKAKSTLPDLTEHDDFVVTGSLHDATGLVDQKEAPNLLDVVDNRDPACD